MRFFKIIFLTFSILFLVSCKNNSTNNIESLSSDYINESTASSDAYKAYYEASSVFVPIDLETLSSNEMSKPAFVYFGRVSCPYCREFVPWLSEVSTKNGWTIYYVDTESFDETVKNEIEAKYLVEEVPTLIYIDSNSNIFRPDDDENVSMEEWIKERY